MGKCLYCDENGNCTGRCSEKEKCKKKKDKKDKKDKKKDKKKKKKKK